MEKDCYMVAAGKKATADGSVMVARSCDTPFGDEPVQLLAVPRKKYESGSTILIPGTGGVKIPQVSETYAYIGVQKVYEDAEITMAAGGINEFQVCAGASSGGWLNEKAQAVCKVSPTSLGDFRMTLFLERAKTAREGIELLGEFTKRFGARKDNYIIADPNEIWWYEEYYENLWAAVRVPDDCFAVQANTVRINHVNFEDPKNFLGSENLISFAIDYGLYDEKDGPFDPSTVYGAQTGKVRHGIPAPHYDTRRVWRGMSLLKPSLNLDPEERNGKYPLFVQPDPDRKLTPKDILTLWTDHYDGTPYDHYGQNEKAFQPTISPMLATDDRKYPESKFHLNEQRQYQLAPIWGTERIIGTPRAVTNWVAQLRSWMPNPIGGLLWAGIGEGATAARIPWYSGITKTPKPYTIGTMESVSRKGPFELNPYDEQSAFWNFRVVTSLVNLFYTAIKDEVIPVWREWEETLFNQQAIIEKTAMELYKQDTKSAIDFITTYSCSKGAEAVEMAKKMMNRVLTIISHFNAPL